MQWLCVSLNLGACMNCTFAYIHLVHIVSWPLSIMSRLMYRLCVDMQIFVSFERNILCIGFVYIYIYMVVDQYSFILEWHFVAEKNSFRGSFAASSRSRAPQPCLANMSRNYTCLYHKVGTDILLPDPSKRLRVSTALRVTRSIGATNSIQSPGGGLGKSRRNSTQNPGASSQHRAMQLGECYNGHMRGHFRPPALPEDCLVFLPFVSRYKGKHL